MCGLVGMFGNTLAKDVTFFKQALIADYFRGKHSTGIMSVAQAGEAVTVIKRAIDPILFLDLKSVDNALTTTKRLMAGHNRHATLGGVNSANAHPFTHGDITLMHNGTLTNKVALQSTYQAPVFDTDSELICWLMDNYDNKTIIEALEGAFALVWWDAQDSSVNFVRNDQRPFAMYQCNNRLYWASEAKMLSWLLTRNNLDLDEKSHIYNLSVGVHLKSKYENAKLTHTSEKVELKPQPVTNYGYNYGNYSGGSTKGKGNGVSTLPVHNSVREKLRKTTGLNLDAGSPVYAYIDNIMWEQKVSGGNYKYNLELKLACDPFLTVRVYQYITDEPIKPEELTLFRGNLTQVVQSSTVKGLSWVLNLNPHTLTVIDAEDSVQEKLYDHWVAEVEPISEKKGEETKEEEKLFTGFDGSKITYKKFKQVVDQGCSICDATLDVVDQAVDRTCVFVSDDDVICKDCADNHELMSQYGFTQLVGVAGL